MIDHFFQRTNETFQPQHLNLVILVCFVFKESHKNRPLAGQRLNHRPAIKIVHKIVILKKIIIMLKNEDLYRTFYIYM